MKKINRKDFLKKSAIGALAASSLAACTNDNAQTSADGSPAIQTGKKYRWKMVTTWPPNYPIIGEGLEDMANWIEEMSGGRMKIKVFGGGELVPPLESFDAVSSGTAEMGHGGAYYWAGKAPAAQFFASVPFGMNAQQMNAWMISGGGLELWRELYAKFSLIPFPCGNTGVQMGGWFNKEINSLADLQGLKMRIPGFGGKVFNKAGGSSVLVAGSEIYTDLERGVIDATEWIGPFHDYKMGFHDIAKYYYAPGWHEAGTTLELFINKPKFEALPKDLQVIIETAAYRYNNWMLAEIEAQNNLFMDKLVNEEKVEIRYFPDEVLEQLRAYTAEILNEITANDPFAKKVYDSYSAFQKRAKAWSEVTEKVFYNKLQ
jgi:TRAP-type mannitol/chloroaromatic compound transport system substrate-binding protein